MNIESLLQKIKLKLNAFLTKSQQYLVISKNYLIEKGKKTAVWVNEASQKALVFIEEQRDKKEVYRQQVKEWLVRVQEKIIRIGSHFLKKCNKYIVIAEEKINKNKKLASLKKEIQENVSVMYSMTKRFVIENYQAVIDQIQEYEWYKQLYAATTYDVVKITVLTGIFINILALAYPLTLMQVYDRVIPNQSYSTLVILTSGVVTAIILEALLRIARSYVNLWCDAKYEYELSKKAFSNLLHVPLYVYENTDIGTRIKQFAVLDQMRGFYNNQLLVAICDMPFLIIFLIVIAYIGGWLVLIPLFLTIFLVRLSFKHVDDWQSALEEKLTYESRENDFLVNVLSSIHTAKSLGMENLLIRRYEKMQNRAVGINFESTVQAADLGTVKSIASQSTTIFMASLGAMSVMHGELAVGSLIACILIAGRYMMPLVRGLAIFSRWKMINIIRGQLDVILHLPVEKEIDLAEIQGVIQLRDVGYLSKSDNFTHWVFKNINIEIPPRSVVTIIGDSKADAEKLLNVLAAIVRPTTGEYLIDGKNVDAYQNYQLRTKITYLSKAGTLFQGSIMDNLSAFNQELIPVAMRFSRLLGLDNVVSKFPAGYDTLVGDKTVETLPVSVINLIYIIRGLVNRPKIILLDEADMDLDVKLSEKLIELLKILKEIATIIILPKNGGIVQFSDVVYELKNKELKRVAFNAGQ